MPQVEPSQASASSAHRVDFEITSTASASGYTSSVDFTNTNRTAVGQIFGNEVVQKSNRDAASDTTSHVYTRASAAKSQEAMSNLVSDYAETSESTHGGIECAIHTTDGNGNGAEV